MPPNPNLEDAHGALAAGMAGVGAEALTMTEGERRLLAADALWMEGNPRKAASAYGAIAEKIPTRLDGYADTQSAAPFAAMIILREALAYRAAGDDTAAPEALARLERRDYAPDFQASPRVTCGSKLPAADGSRHFFATKDFDPGQVDLSRLDTLFVANGMHPLQLRDLKLAHIQRDALVFINCDDPLLHHLAIRGVSGAAIRVKGGRRHTLHSCVIQDTGNHGIVMIRVWDWPRTNPATRSWKP